MNPYERWGGSPNVQSSRGSGRSRAARSAVSIPSYSPSIGGVELHGPTLTLRYATPDDAPALFELASDREVTRFFSWGPYTRLEEPVAYIIGLAGRRERGEQLDLLIVHRDDGPIGVVGLAELSQRDRRAVIGTWLGRRWWGSGANAEVKALVARLAFEHLGLERLGAYADVENGRSRAALERLGFMREGLLRRWHRHGDAAHDVHVFGLLREEWARSPLAAVPVELDGEPPEAFVIGPSRADQTAGGGAAGGARGVAGSPSSGENGG
jgi:ribosomal-protein-alanine N-acetyltransferase